MTDLFPSEIVRTARILYLTIMEVHSSFDWDDLSDEEKTRWCIHALNAIKVYHSAMADSCKQIYSSLPYQWNEWIGGEFPLLREEPVEVLWPNGLTKKYERSDHVVWRNLKTDGSVRWRKI